MSLNAEYGGIPRKANRWLAWVGYVPGWRGLLRRFDAFKQPRPGGNWAGQPPRPPVSHYSWTDRLIHLISPILGPAVVAAVVILSRPVVQQVPATVLPRETLAIEIERESDDSTARARVNTEAPEAINLYDAWNSAGAIFEFGHRTGTKPKYLPLPRKGFELAFRQLEYEGFAGLKLYVVHVPQLWDEATLDLHRYKWAADCGIQREWIPDFSAFRQKPWKKKISECHPGGTCIIVSFGCRGDTFDDVQ